MQIQNKKKKKKNLNLLLTFMFLMTLFFLCVGGFRQLACTACYKQLRDKKPSVLTYDKWVFNFNDVWEESKVSLFFSSLHLLWLHHLL